MTTQEEYIAEHTHEALFYGVTPLSKRRLVSYYRKGRTLEYAYSVACDKDAGFTYAEAEAALN